jgi:hypothetical protein
MAGNKAVAQALWVSCRAFRATLPKLIVTGAMALALAGCAEDNRVRVCPMAAILAPTAETVGFRPNLSGDPSGELYRVAMTAVSSECTIEEESRQVSADMDITFRATRTPDGTAAQYSVPYYVVVSEGEHVVAKRSFTLQFSFGPGDGAAEFRETIDSTVFRVDNDKQAIQYRLLAGFQLTQEQLDYLKKMGRYAP